MTSGASTWDWFNYYAFPSNIILKNEIKPIDDFSPGQVSICPEVLNVYYVYLEYTRVDIV